MKIKQPIGNFMIQCNFLPGTTDQAIVSAVAGSTMAGSTMAGSSLR